MLVAFAATLAAHMLWLPFWYSALLGGVVLARWLQRRSYARAWPGWIKFPLLVAIIAMVVVEYGVPSARQSGTAALTGFCALKLIESERRRDGLMIMTVCLFLISVQFLFNQGILISMYMALPTLLVFLALNEVSAPPGTQGGLVSRLDHARAAAAARGDVADDDLPVPVGAAPEPAAVGQPVWRQRKPHGNVR
jgi:hypothetical protein